MTSLVLGSMAVESFDRPLKVKICLVVGSKQTESGFLSGLRFADLGERLKIKDRDAVRLPIGDKSFPEFGRNGDSVNAMQLRDLPHHFAGGGVHNLHQGCVRSVDAVRVGIHRHIIPAAGAADFDFGQDFESFSREGHDRQQTSCDQELFHDSSYSFKLNLVRPNIETNGRRYYQRKDHRSEDPANYRNGQRLQHLRTGANGKRQRKHAGHGGQARSS